MTVDQQIPRTDDGSAQRPLSANEEFLYAFDRGDELGVFGPRGIVLGGWRIRGPLDPATLQLALNDVVERHEVLRTSVIRDTDTPGARVHPPQPVDLTIVDLPPTAEADRERRAHEFFNEVDQTGRLAATQRPLLQARLGRFDGDDAALVLITNHLASDGWSMHVIVRDLAILYATHRGLPAPELPELRQYGEFARLQQQARDTEFAAVAREYWRTKLAGGRICTLSTDRTRRLDVPPVYAVYRFLFDRELVRATTSLAESLNSSSFMIFYASFNLFLHRRTGATDIVSPIITSGRTEPGFEHTVGALFNFLPIRTGISGCQTFADVVRRTRTTLLEAYSNYLPFTEIIAQSEPELMRTPAMSVDSVVTAFQISQFPPELEAESVGDIRYAALRRRLISSVDTSEIPDGNLWDFDLAPAGDMVGVVKFNSLDFDQSTIVAMVDEYRDLLRASVASPDSPLPQ